MHQEELSDTFGKYGDIVGIDMIIPRGCAFIAMNRRQDAYKAMNSLRSHKMQGRAITISWATGKGVKSKEWKDYWDLDLGVSYIPWGKLTAATDFEALEEGGMFDEDSMPEWLKKQNQQPNKGKKDGLGGGGIGDGMFDASQPPPGAASLIGGLPLVPPFGISRAAMMAPPLGLPLANLGIPLGVPPPPPPHQMMLPGLAGITGGIDKNPNLHLPPYQIPGNLGLIKPPSNNNNGDDHMEIDNDDDDDVKIVEPKGAALGGGQLLLSEQLMALTSFFNRPPPIMPGGVNPQGNSIPPGLMHAGIPPLIPPNMPSEEMMGRRSGNDRNRGGRDEREFDDRRWGGNDGGGHMGRERNSGERDEFARRGRGGNYPPAQGGGIPPIFADRPGGRDNGEDRIGGNHMMGGRGGGDPFDRTRDGEFSETEEKMEE